MRMSRFPVLALLASVVPAAASAGVYLETQEKELDSSDPPTVSKVWFDSGRMRSEQKQPDGEMQIVIFGNQTMYSIDPAGRTYRAINKADAERMGGQLAEARRKMEEQMKNMSPEQRATIEKMMGRLGAAGQGLSGQGPVAAPKRTLKNTGRSETVAGIKCTVWEASENGEKDEELCAAPPASIPGGDEVMATFREIGQMMKSLTESFGAQLGAANEPWNDMETINGVPILTREFSDGKATSETRLSVVRRESVPASSFEVPAGYTQDQAGFGSQNDDE